MGIYMVRYIVKNMTSFCILQSGKVYGRLKKLIYPFGLR